MLNVHSKGSVVFVCLLLAACSQNSQQSEEPAHRERDAELAQSLANEATADPRNLFGPAQTLAEDSIGAAVGADIDQTWVRKMIEHQEGSARFSTILLNAKPSVPAQRMAQRIAQDAHARVEALTALRSGSSRMDQGSADAFGAATSDIFAKMGQVQAQSAEQTWALKMVEYDKGGVAFAGIEATRGKDPRIRSFAREVAASLANEAEAIEKLAEKS